MTTRNSPVWLEPPARVVDPALEHHLNLPPLVARILTQRGIATPEQARAFLDPACYHPAAPDQLPDLALAADHLERAIRQRQPILIWGDFDVDGQTSTALLYEALLRLGAVASYYIPHRIRESHGILVESLQAQLKQFPAALLLTCDTGVSAHAAVDYAKQAGLTVIITDHHDLPPRLPAADAVINPKRLPAAHPLAALPGVGTAYKLVELLYTRFDRAGDLDGFLDLVALGIVVDVARQTGDTRYLLQRGLDQLRVTPRAGLRALMANAALQPEHVTATDVAFQIGPRLNAAGRLDDARPAVELLTTADPGRAVFLAAQLEALNQQRQLQSRQMFAAACAQIEQDSALLDTEALVLSSPAWHAGLIGLVASQLADTYQRPTVLITVAGDGTARGSARSVPGYDIAAAIAAQADLLLSHGGHPGAAGLSLHENNLPAFRRRLSDTLRATRDPAAVTGIALDAVIGWHEVTPELAAALERLAPFGEGNPPVTLAACDLTLRSAALIGRTRQHRRLTVQNAAGLRWPVLWWNGASQALPDSPFDLAFRLSLSAYRGTPELQLELVDFRRSASAPEVSLPVQREAIDRRHAPDPYRELRGLLDQFPGAAIYAEGYRRAETPGTPAHDLAPASTLILFTTPPDRAALRAIMERVNPERVAVLAVDPPIRALPDLERRVLELAKYVIRYDRGRTTLDALSSATGHSLRTLDALLTWFESQGTLDVEWLAGGALQLSKGSGEPGANGAAHRAAVEDAFAETAAYRAFVHRADPFALLDWAPTP